MTRRVDHINDATDAQTEQPAGSSLATPSCVAMPKDVSSLTE